MSVYMILDAEIHIDGYNFYRGDRNFALDKSKSKSNDVSEGGGCIIYYKSQLADKISLDECFKAPDSLAINMNTGSGKVKLCCIYRSQSLNIMQNHTLLTSVKNASDISNEHETIMFGDFNLPDVNWVTGSVIAPENSKNVILNNEMEFMNMFHKNGLNWLLTDEITRRRLVNGC